MIQNGLLLASIGFLLFMFSINRTTLQYDFLLMATSLFFIISGGILFFKGSKKNKKKTDVDDEVKK